MICCSAGKKIIYLSPTFSKANFGILEGFLSELLHEDIKIMEILESEGNSSLVQLVQLSNLPVPKSYHKLEEDLEDWEFAIKSLEYWEREYNKIENNAAAA